MAKDERIPTNMRALLILEIIGNSDQAVSTATIVEKIGLARQTVHRLLTTLETEGFLVREGSAQFRPSRRLRRLGTGLLHASSHHIARHQVLGAVSTEVKETVNFVVPRELGMHYLDRVESDWVFQMQLPRGSDVPFHCTASGKTFMASLRKAERERFVGALQLNRMTDNTITDASDLLAELDLVRKRGFAEDREEFVEEMTAFAVPVHGEGGHFVGALATHGPKFRMSNKDPAHYVGALKKGASRLGSLM